MMKASWLTRSVATVWIHLLGVVSVTLVTTLPFLDMSVVEAYVSAMKMAEFRTFSESDLIIHVLLAACIWALMFISYRLIRTRVRQHKLRRYECLAEQP